MMTLPKELSRAENVYYNSKSCKNNNVMSSLRSIWEVLTIVMQNNKNLTIQ